MKHNIIKYYKCICLSSVIIFSITSCKKDWFDVKSDKRLTVPSTLKDFELLLDNFAIMNTLTPGLGEVGSDGHYITENRWAILPNANAINAQRNAYTWTFNFPYLGLHDWNKSYEKVFHCNLVLDGLKAIKPNAGEQEQYNRIKGNALFHRAKNYYELAQIYAQPYQPGSAGIDMGIPLKEGIDITEPAKRSTVQETYAQILKDLLDAASLLPNMPSFLSRGSKTAAYALLARTYLIIGDYNKAGMYSDLSLKNYNVLIDYNTIPITATSFGIFNAETIFFSTSTQGYSFNWNVGYLFIDPALYKLYGNGDLRKSRLFTESADGIVFKGTYNLNAVPFSGIATDEIYLIRAECFARIGNIDGALKDLNDLLKTRWDRTLVYPVVTASTADEALIKILIERKKELLMRGIRWSDLRRLNREDRFKITLTRSIGGQDYALEPNSYKYTLPIPNDVMDVSNLQQSPGW